MITRCDLKQVFHLNLDDREYAALERPAYPDVHDLRAAAGRQESVLTRDPTVLVETETVDTRERKELFGHSARRVITTTRVTPLAGPQRPSTHTVTDGWYIDLDTQCSCDPPWRPAVGQAFLTLHKAGEKGDVPTFTNVGEPERGYALSRRVTSQHNLTLADGSVTEVTSVLETAVTDLSMAAIEPGTFEIPPGFQLVEAIRQEPKPPLMVRWKRTYDRVARRFQFDAARNGRG